MLVRNIILFVFALCTVFNNGAFCATARGRAVQQNNQTQSVTSARAAVNTRTAPRAAAPATTGGRTTAARSAKPAATTPQPKTVAARAATQSVINTGTKLAESASANVASDCQSLYNACMDNFCMLDNFDGGRCVCSNRYGSFNKLLSEIDDIKMQAYKLETVGVEQIESVVTKNPALEMENMSNVAKKEINYALENGEIGDALRESAHETCVRQIPQCSAKMAILPAMYSGRINSDCVGYENSLKQLRTDAKQKLQLAEGNLREIALDSAKNANKYDLGQCTIEFRKCMQKPDVCNADFTGCVDTVEMAKARVKNTQSEEIVTIPGSTAGLFISKSMHESLLAKSVMCSPVLENCVKVRDQVFNSFLADSAASLQVAENLAEYNARTNCIKSVSDCFHNACRDNIDPNDPDGSYDACLTRPEMMLTMCKPQLDICGVDTKDGESARKSQIWEFVLARLAGMKVDSCTSDLKNCLADKDRCGPDYTQCVGLSTEQIIKMCPYDKLLGCKNVYGETVTSNEIYEKLYQTVQGIILNIDNAMLATCQAAVDAAAYRACGPDLDCAGLVDLETLGTTSLDYKICEIEIDGENISTKDKCYRDIAMIPDSDLGRVEGSETDKIGKITTVVPVIEPMIYWEELKLDSNGLLVGVDEYVAKIEEESTTKISDLQRERLMSELRLLQNSISSIKDIIQLDPTVDACINGRSINGIPSEKVGRFPNITNSTITVLANTLLKRAKSNYYAKYDEYTEKSMKDSVSIVERIYKMRDENAKDARREIARQSCINLAENSALPRQMKNTARALRKSADAMWISAGSAGLAAAVCAATIPATWVAGMACSIISAFIAAILSAVAGGLEAAVQDYDTTMETSDRYEYAGAYKLYEFNHKEDITTIFDPINITCEKCVVTTECAEVQIDHGRIIENCLQWAEPIKTCNTIQF
ncbi:MAG: hypothetical protein ACLRFK_01550 [Alphaproteobacteria bacterium]